MPKEEGRRGRRKPFFIISTTKGWVDSSDFLAAGDGQHGDEVEEIRYYSYIRIWKTLVSSSTAEYGWNIFRLIPVHKSRRQECALDVSVSWPPALSLPCVRYSPPLSASDHKEILIKPRQGSLLPSPF